MTRYFAVLAVAAVAGCSQSLDTGSRLGELVNKVTTVAPAIVEIVNALGIDPIDMSAEEKMERKEAELELLKKKKKSHRKRHRKERDTYVSLEKGNHAKSFRRLGK